MPSNEIAHRLLELMGERSAPVAILMDLEADVISSIYGSLKAGKYYVSLDPELPVKRLKFVLNETKLRVLITNDRFAHLGRSLLEEGQTLFVTKSDFHPHPSNPAGLASPTDLAYVMYTSGSTGDPKGVMHTNRNLLFDMCRQGRNLQTDSNDCYGLLFAASSSASRFRHSYKTQGRRSSKSYSNRWLETRHVFRRDFRTEREVAVS